MKKLEKVIINGEEYYKEVESDESGDNVSDNKTGGTGKEKTDFDWSDRLTGKNGILNNVNNLVNKSLKEANRTINEAMGSVSGRNNKAHNRKTDKLLKMMPFMDDDDIHEIMEHVLNKDEGFEDIDLNVLLPFIDDDDIDLLFMRYVKDGMVDEVTKTIPFVSDDCLSDLVGEYVKGKYQDLDMDSMYPYLDEDDIKKLFYYEMKKNNNE